jgi:hypothetical protein
VFATRDLTRKAVISVNATDKSTTGPNERLLRIYDAATR